MTPSSFASALVQQGATSSRQAAIFLHGLDGSDRTWLLEQLEPTQRRLLVELLAELATLGVPSSASRGWPSSPARAVTPSAEPPPPTSPMRAAAEQIARMPVSDVVEVLRCEPDAIVVRVMRRLDPAWSRRFSSRLDAPRRARVTSLSGRADHTAAEALDLAVLQAVCRRAVRRAAGLGLRARAESAMRHIGREWHRLLAERHAQSEVGS